MRLRPRAIVVITAILAVTVFCVVQDRVTAAGALRYTALQRDALAGRGSAVTIDEIMRPAIAKSVQQGVYWGAGVMAAGLAVAAAAARLSAPLDGGSS
jgi:hypothetical protein